MSINPQAEKRATTSSGAGSGSWWHPRSPTDAWETTVGHVVGPMPAQEFLDTFLPTMTTGPTKANPTKANATSTMAETSRSNLGGNGVRLDFTELRRAKTKSQMRSAWINALKPTCGRILAQIDSNNQPLTPLNPTLRAPDISVYFKTPTFLRTAYDFKKVEISVEVRRSASEDPFDDRVSSASASKRTSSKPARHESFFRDGDKAKATLSQLFLYATAHFGCQFRTHVFQILVFPTYARLLRWDRNGVVVTQKIDLTQEDSTTSKSIISAFYSRLQFDATVQDRGFDETIRPAIVTGAQAKSIRKALKVGPKVALFQLDVAGRTFIIPDLTSTPLKLDSPFGRQTMGILVYDLLRKKQFFMKDTWRIWNGVHPFPQPEHLVLERLHTRGVQHIPVLECGGDVDPTGKTHQTRTQEFLNAEWSKGISEEDRIYRHYRVVIEELEGRVSECCKTVREVVVVVRDAGEAHAQAYDKAQITHHDISEGNIMARRNEDNELEGVLIDWEFCEETGRESYRGRTGTWYFLAARLLHIENPSGSIHQDRIDDIESFFHVLIYLTTHFTNHSLSSDSLSQFIESYFIDQTIHEDGSESGGIGKLKFLLEGEGESGESLFRYVNHQRLRGLLRDLTKPLGVRCKVQKEGRIEDKADKNLLRNLEDVYWFPKTLSRALRAEGWDDAINGKLMRRVNTLSPGGESERKYSEVKVVEKAKVATKDSEARKRKADGGQDKTDGEGTRPKRRRVMEG